MAANMRTYAADGRRASVTHSEENPNTALSHNDRNEMRSVPLEGGEIPCIHKVEHIVCLARTNKYARSFQSRVRDRVCINSARSRVFSWRHLKRVAPLNSARRSAILSRWHLILLGFPKPAGKTSALHKQTHTDIHAQTDRGRTIITTAYMRITGKSLIVYARVCVCVCVCSRECSATSAPICLARSKMRLWSAEERRRWWQ